jgi:hypothetical protein
VTILFKTSPFAWAEKGLPVAKKNNYLYGGY